MTIVIDASVAVKWVLDERGTDAALALTGEELIAPALWLAEAASALWRHVRLGEITAAEALARMTELKKAPVVALAIEPYVSRALEIAMQVDHPVHDCFYLAVAVHQGAELVTDDRRLVAAAARAPELADRVRVLGA